MYDQSPKQNTQAHAVSGYDAGLKRHFGSVYSTMGIGLFVTGLTAFALSNIPALMNLVFGTPLAYVVMFAPMIFLMFGFSSRRVVEKSANQLRVLFYTFCAVFGLSMSAIFLVFTGADIARAFFVTAATFMAMSIFGYSTKLDLSKMSAFLMMGTVGLLIAIVVNVFLQSDMMQFIISCVGVLCYTLWTAFHTQSIKESYSSAYSDESNSKAAVLGSLNLYIDFMMLFQFILSLMANRE
jgi:FtsH-binding integral membrane protein